MTNNLLQLTTEQQTAYNRFIKARDRIRNNNSFMSDNKDEVPAIIFPNDVLNVVEVAGINHPMYEANEPYLEYQQAFQNWLAVEPRFRHDERMRMSRGDYGTQDSWDNPKERIKDLVTGAKSIKSGGIVTKLNTKGESN